MFLRDFPLLYHKKGGSLKIAFNLGWFCIRRPVSAGQYYVTNGNIFFHAV